MSQIDPIGGFVAVAGKPVLVHKGLQIINGMVIWRQIVQQLYDIELKF